MRVALAATNTDECVRERGVRTATALVTFTTGDDRATRGLLHCVA
jgi:hypothetical protein